MKKTVAKIGLVGGIIAIAIALLIVLGLSIPRLVLKEVIIKGVVKSSEIVIYDKASQYSLKVGIDNFSYPDQLENDVCYIDKTIYELAAVLAEELSGHTVLNTKNVIYIVNNANANYFYIRLVDSEYHPKQGYEYRTSNAARLLTAGYLAEQQMIFLPYHLIDYEAGGDADSQANLAKGNIKQKKEYKVTKPFSEIVGFYKTQTFMLVSETKKEQIMVVGAGYKFLVNDLGDNNNSFDMSVSMIEGEVSERTR